MSEFPTVILQPKPPSTKEEREVAIVAFALREITDAAMCDPVLGKLTVWTIGLRSTYEGTIWTEPRRLGTFDDMLDAERARVAALASPRWPGRWWAVIVDGREVGR